MTEEDEEFERIEKESGWRKRQIMAEDDDIQEYKKPWVGLKPSDLQYLSEKWRILYGEYVIEFAEEIEAILRSRNL